MSTKKETTPKKTTSKASTSSKSPSKTPSKPAAKPTAKTAVKPKRELSSDEVFYKKIDKLFVDDNTPEVELVNKGQYNISR